MLWYTVKVRHIFSLSHNGHELYIIISSHYYYYYYYYYLTFFILLSISCLFASVGT